MSVHTEYDEHRDYLRDDLQACLDYAEKYLLDETIWGYDDMKYRYADDVIKAIKYAIYEV